MDRGRDVNLVQHDGRHIWWFPHPTARRRIEWEVSDAPAARWRASIIERIVAGEHEPDEDSPLWTVMVAWMFYDAPRLSPGSFPSYAGDIKTIDKAIGRTPLSACHDHVVYQQLFTALDQAGASESKRRCVARTLGSICTWAQGTKWWPHRHDMFGHGAARGKIKRSAFRAGAEADAKAGRTSPPIEAKDCPSVEETLAFCQTLRDVCTDRWGPNAGYLAGYPITQYVTGGRYLEVFAYEPSAFNLASSCPTIDIRFQVNKYVPYEDGRPSLKLPKNGAARRAGIWDWATEELERIVADACQHRRPFLFMAPSPDLSTFTRQFLSAYQVAQEAAEYPYTSHWHRHAYASFNLATPVEGGYGRSLKVVSGWLGHTKTDITASRYWHPQPAEQGWSSHRPGERR